MYRISKKTVGTSTKRIVAIKPKSLTCIGASGKIDTPRISLSGGETDLPPSKVSRGMGRSRSVSPGELHHLSLGSSSLPFAP